MIEWIVALLRKANAEQLRQIYIFVKAFLGEYKSAPDGEKPEKAFMFFNRFYGRISRIG